MTGVQTCALPICLISEVTGLHVYLAEDPVACVAVGTGRSLAVMDRNPEGGSLLARKAL